MPPISICIGTRFSKAYSESISRQKEWMVQIVVSSKSDGSNPASVNMSRMRSFSSPAAFSVKVTSRMFLTLTGSLSATSLSTMR